MPPASTITQIGFILHFCSKTRYTEMVIRSVNSDMLCHHLSLDQGYNNPETDQSVFYFLPKSDTLFHASAYLNVEFLSGKTHPGGLLLILPFCNNGWWFPSGSGVLFAGQQTPWWLRVIKADASFFIVGSNRLKFRSDFPPNSSLTVTPFSCFCNHLGNHLVNSSVFGFHKHSLLDLVR